MRFKIPFEGSNIDRLKKVSKPYCKKIRQKPNSKLSMYLKNSGAPIKREEYLGICRRSFLNSFFVLLFASFVLLFIFRREKLYFLAIGVSLLISVIAYMNQRAYPKIYFLKRQRDIERNLIPALEDVLIQLSSGIPLFSILVNISDSDYGELSVEFKKAVQKINAGEAEVDVLEELGENNPSNYFRRVLWQLSNGMRAGSDMMVVIQDNLHSLNEEQMIQIQEYGNKLNPLIMFYMLISVIAPALSVTFMTILSSMISLPKNMTVMAFMGLFVFVVLIQIMFLGIIKSKRPSLM
ncbi:MAG: type II secretion system F family protein [archaeon]